MTSNESWQGRLEGLGEFIRAQRRLANMSLRDLAERTEVSNPYLSQIERGLHEPSVRVIKAIAMALDLSAETLLFQAGVLDREGVAAAEREGDDEAGVGGRAGATVAAIRSDPHLTEEQKQALLAVYQSYRAAGRRHTESPGAG